ncbi:MAG: hypothetical protein P4M13_00310 [Alphaproteobacteria bacterium]|nr:hypothetical protein [Alphaproteobacteria bacterium]
MNFRIPDFPLGGLFIAILVAVGILFAVPNLPYPWLWILAVIFGSAVWALGAGLCAPVRHGEGAERPHEHDKPQSGDGAASKEGAGALVSNGAKSPNPADGKKDKSKSKERFWCCANRWFWWLVGGLKAVDSLITALATVLLAALTGGIVWVAVWQWDALKSTDKTLHDTLVASTRAWVEPLTLSLNEPLKAGTDGNLTLIIDNSGREPAVKIGRYEEFGIVDMRKLPTIPLNNDSA